jgi:DNA processing protein
VVEAALKSGSLITAKFALEQGRDVACVPGFPMDPRSEGTNMLIKRGASLITSAKDLMELVSNFSSKEIKLDRSLFEDAEEFILEENSPNNNFNLLELIGSSPVSVDDLVTNYNLKAADINSKLLEYEIMGEIVRHPGNKVSKAA